MSAMAFVSFMAVVVAIVALALAGRQSGHAAGALSDGAASRLCYASAAVLLVDAVAVVRYGRSRPAVTACCTVVFIAATAATLWLFGRAW